MKILLIVPAYPKVIVDTTSIPLGLASIGTCLKQVGFDVTCIDTSVSNLDMMAIDYKKYDIVGIQLHSVEGLSNGIKFIKNVNQQTDAKIVVGGVVATLYSEELLKYKEIDYIILNEGENTFVELANALQNHEDLLKIAGLIINAEKPVKTGQRDFIKDLNDIPIIDRTLFEYGKYKQWSIITSRGCPFRCKFCTVPSFWRNSYRQRSPENVFEEIQQLVEQYDVSKIFILDDSFTANKRSTMSLLNMIRNWGRKFEWACLTRADLIDEELAAAMAEAGCSTISMGVESANQDTLDALNKHLKLKTIEKAIAIIKKVKIRVRCSYIFGFPEEREQHLENNIRFIQKTQPDEVQIYPLFPYFGTELFRGNQLGLDLFENGKDALQPVIGTKYLSKDTIAKYVKLCVDVLQEDGYTWMSSYSTAPRKGDFRKVVMTEFAPIQALKCMTREN